MQASNWIPFWFYEFVKFGEKGEYFKLTGIVIVIYLFLLNGKSRLFWKDFTLDEFDEKGMWFVRSV